MKSAFIGDGSAVRFCLCCFAFSNARFFLPALPFPWLLRRKRLLPQALRRLSLMEAESGRILFAQNASLRLPMASTTKIMTALVVRVSVRFRIRLP